MRAKEMENRLGKCEWRYKWFWFSVQNHYREYIYCEGRNVELAPATPFPPFNGMCVFAGGRKLNTFCGIHNIDRSGQLLFTH